jgi:hypothetical protein
MAKASEIVSATRRLWCAQMTVETVPADGKTSLGTRAFIIPDAEPR